MAGIYIHIPFCRQACTYCDFHFSTSLNIKKEVVAAIKTELELRKNYLNEPVETIYFGGGTPSLLSAAEIDAIIEAIFKNYAVDLKECTLEANPDDLAKSYLTELAKTKVNRLSMGIQSFNDGVLKWMNRTHNSQTAIAAVKDAYRSGIQNISIDLIYATPNSTVKDIEKNLSIALSLPVNHLSAYCLTAEEKTVYGKMVSTGKISEAEQENAQQQFLFLVHRATENGFEQYEISNFCKNENYAMHNTSYWKNRNYLGIGPSAHSYNGTSRQWNLKNNFSYVKAIKENTSFLR
ncbi:MAG: radical SAM family heme chaperone HemW [Bacteroidetes bacterium]|nr:radical SAM family heme chaperone HemW [Bacteroidota bacterium]